MFVTKASDFASLESIPYAWRWTNRSPVEIPESDLRHIRPFTDLKALEAWEYAKRFQGKRYWDEYEEVGEFNVDGRVNSRDDTLVFDWLSKTLPSVESTTIFISWTEAMSVQTQRSIFVEYWDAFCFPVEDVVIWPQDESWVLLFDYKQRFYFAGRRA